MSCSKKEHIMDYKISVLIRTYNEQKHLGEVLKSLSCQTYKHFETIILDSGSTDDTLKIAQAYNVRVEHIAKSEFNYSFASNKLVEYASGEVVCFLSGHSVPVRNTYLVFINKIFQDPKIGGCYGKVIALPDGSFTEKTFYGLSYLKSKLISNHASIIQEQKIHPGILSCCNAGVRRELLLKHPFANELGGGGEDIEVAYRIIQDGYYIVNVPELLVKHSHGKGLVSFLKQYRQWQKIWCDAVAYIQKKNLIERKFLQ